MLGSTDPLMGIYISTKPRTRFHSGRARIERVSSRGIRRMKRVKNILLLDRLLFIVRKMVDEVRAFCRGKIMKFCRDRVVMYLLRLT